MLLRAHGSLVHPHRHSQFGSAGVVFFTADAPRKSRRCFLHDEVPRLATLP